MQFCPFQDNQEKAVLDVIDQVFPVVLEKSLQTVPQSEKVHKSYFELSPTDATSRFNFDPEKCLVEDDFQLTN